MPKTSFQVFDEMAILNDKSLMFAPLTNIVEVKIQGPGKGLIVVGVPEELIHDFLKGRQFVGGLILADKDAFERIKNN